MRRCLVIAIVLLTSTLPSHASPGCDQCADLPMLYRELLEQEFLRNRFERWIREAYYPVSIAEMRAAAIRDLNRATSGDLYGALAPPQAGGPPTGAPSAAPAYGTDTSTKECRLVEYVKDRNGNDIERPVTPEQVRKKLCAPLAEYILAHEGHHMNSCRAAWDSGGDRKLGTVEFFVQDDRDAYQAGVAVLRQHIAALARKCAWTGSTSNRKPDGTQVVPTPHEVTTLQNNTVARARLLKRATR
jgi:hypothetical protein